MEWRRCIESNRDFCIARHQFHSTLNQGGERILSVDVKWPKRILGAFDRTGIILHPTRTGTNARSAPEATHPLADEILRVYVLSRARVNEQTLGANFLHARKKRRHMSILFFHFFFRHQQS